MDKIVNINNIKRNKIVNTNIHFNVELETSGITINYDNSKAVCLTFIDKDNNSTDSYPIPLDIAKDLAQEILRIAKKMEEKTND